VFGCEGVPMLEEVPPIIYAFLRACVVWEADFVFIYPIAFGLPATVPCSGSIKVHMLVVCCLLFVAVFPFTS